MAVGNTITSVKDLVALAGQMLETAETEIVYLVPPSILSYASQYSFAREAAKKLIKKGGRIRGITNLSFYYIDAVRELLDIGEDVRHVNNSQEALIFIRDKKESVSAMTAVTEELLFNDRIVAFWSEDAIYAEYLLSSFESAWTKSIPAAARIQDLIIRATKT